MVDKAKSHSTWKVNFSPFSNQLRKNCYRLYRNYEDNYAGPSPPRHRMYSFFLTSHCIGVTEKNMTISKCFCPSNVFRTNHCARCTAPTWSRRGHCSLTCVRKLSGNAPWGQNKQTEPEEEGGKIMKDRLIVFIADIKRRSVYRWDVRQRGTRCNIRKNEKAFFTTVSKQRDRCAEKRGRRPSFLTTTRCFETVVKNNFEFFI